jgi:DNA-binding IclR family transcriptional regulator
MGTSVNKVSRSVAMSSTLRCLRLLEIMGAEPCDMALTEVARSLSIPTSSAHRIILTLITAGFVAQDVNTRRYRLTGKVLWIGTAFLRQADVYRSTYVTMQRLAHRAEAMVHLGIWDNGAVLYLHTTGPLQSLYRFADVGERRPAHCTALGKVLLAHRSPEEVRHVLETRCKRYTETTITSFTEMSEELGKVRERGYAVDNGEQLPNVRCVAAPVRGERGEVVAALSISGSFKQFEDTRLLELAQLVQDAALQASIQLGYRPNAVSWIPDSSLTV